MIDKKYCMSSYLALRYVEKKDVDFCSQYHYKHFELLSDEKRDLVRSAEDIHFSIERQVAHLQKSGAKIGILLSGGMDSAILASYLSGCDAYTFRFLNGEYQKDELKRAEYYAKHYKLKLHYVDILWDKIADNIRPIMIEKGGPVHSIEPQIMQGALEAKRDGINLMIIGDGSDYVFGGMDQLLSKDWKFDDFLKRYIYVDPFEILKEPVSVQYVFERYRKNDYIDFIKFLDIVATEESYGSYSNAFSAADLKYYDPYERMRMVEPLDLDRIRSGESKYLIRELFKLRYPECPVPEKLPMPRPVDHYFSNWKGPNRNEFRKDINMAMYSGNQKLLMWCLEKFLDMIEEA